jgi:hypothetical protein
MPISYDRRTASAWATLANPVFRKLWIAAVISGTCVVAHDTAATWMMNMLTPSPLLISLLSTVASLPFFLFTLPAGALWTLSASELWLAAQRAMPGWARGRMNATVIMVSQGALALGGVIWGLGVATTGPTSTLLAAAILFLISLPLACPLSVNFTGTLNFDPALGTSFSPKLIFRPQRRDGPVSITAEFKVDCAHGRQFIDLMREVRLIHLRNGVYGWRLQEDLTRPNTFRLEMIVPSWNEHSLLKERVTKAEKDLLKRAWSLHVGPDPPEERIYLSVNRELLTPRQCECEPRTAPKKSARPRDRRDAEDGVT